MTHQTHAYHIVNPSPWPLTGAFSALLLTSGLVIWFHYNSITLLTLGLLTNILTIYQWWRDVIREGTYQGHHTPIVQKGLRYGIILFIVSEVFFFAGFFWAFYHSSLVPTHDLGGCWPPTGISPLNPLEVPLLNTSVLLASGVSITWAHHSLIEGKRNHINQALLITIILGLYFTILQASEYFETSFSISDGIYGSTFFMATGFHGLHVIIGSTFLIVCLLRQLKFHFTSKHHFGFEAAHRLHPRPSGGPGRAGAWTPGRSASPDPDSWAHSGTCDLQGQEELLPLTRSSWHLPNAGAGARSAWDPGTLGPSLQPEAWGHGWASILTQPSSLTLNSTPRGWTWSPREGLNLGGLKS